MSRIHTGRRKTASASVLRPTQADPQAAKELDRELLRLCEVLQQTQRELDAVWAEESAMGIDDPRAVPLTKRRVELIELRHETLAGLSDLPAHTREGLKAKAEVALTEYQGEADPEFRGSYEPRAALVASLARDVLGGPRA